MLIGSEITYGDALSILYEVRVIVNHADRDKVLLKKSCHEITLPTAKARFAQLSIDKRMYCTVSDDALSILA